MANGGRILKSALTLGTGILVSKILGAIYRIPLTNVLGGYGIGLYQTVFPVYAVLLDFAGAGVPSALSKIISSKKEGGGVTSYEYLLSSVKLLSLVGIVFSVLLGVLSRVIASLQGNSSIYLSYILLSPSVFLVALISCYRGYFQGLSDMKPTAISQIIEQSVKLFVGLTLATVFLPDVEKSVAGAVSAITVSEVVALVFLLIYSRKKRKEFSPLVFHVGFFYRSGEIIKNTVPITITGIAIPLSKFIDSFIIVNVLSSYTDNATALYGLFSGVGTTIVNLPVSVCYAVAIATIPAVASARYGAERIKARNKAFLYTLLISAAGFSACFFGSSLIVKILFPRLSVTESATASMILKYSSFGVIFLSVLQTENAILFARGETYRPILGIGIGIILKTALSFVLLFDADLNIYGAVIAESACYFSASLINLIGVFKRRNESKIYSVRKLTA